ncbi:MAG: hypothetical protein E6Q97_31380 [Desulfurellales bacterium]|nr:MAG: hypothetical protein E6Q97_31380 [Desulfurellales bacterium]
MSMIKWALGLARRPSFADARAVAPGAIVAVGVALLALSVFLIWKPFKVRIPGGVMTVSECGANLSQMRAETLEKGLEQQREVVRAAELAREQAAQERSEALTRAALLAQMLDELKREEGKRGPNGAVCLPADLARKWNKGNYR